LYTDVEYPEDCYLMFGKESAGIPEEILAANPTKCVRIPMMEGERSLNLSNAAAILTYEALRQHNFAHLQAEGGAFHDAAIQEQYLEGYHRESGK
ncbi:MAG: hypothetical protein KBS83_03490, partial [Lachnospiraceae bacterium]|nr:hypothetical protein [Candidatus Equihabitans merdae]